ncbi:MAG: type IV pilus assembly protein PilM [Magnetococcales bacterium]|nr:type IV pilus assembly protein PilM [Magnetococcales bacterium]NGZ25878.1 type IV pilus assembly protein PilM [Magnetococcales bacterium]
MFSLGQSFKPVVGLDFSSSGIKMAEVRPAGKKWKLIHSGFAPLPPGAIAESQVKDKEVVSQALKDLMKANKVSTKDVAFSVNGSAVIIKKIQLATVSELELEDTIVTEAEEYIPFDIEEVHLDFQILNSTPENMDVLLVACKKDVVQNHMEVLQGAGLVPKILDLDLFCLGNFYLNVINPNWAKSQENAAIINIGASVTNVVVMCNGIPEFTRDHLFGSRHLLEDIQRAYDLNAEDALCLQTGLPNEAGKEIPQPPDYDSELLQPFLGQIHQQLAQSLDFYSAGHQDKPVTTLYLAGGCSLIPGIAPFLESQFNEISVKLVDPFQLIETGKESQPGGPLFGFSPRFAVAIGLALRGMSQ